MSTASASTAHVGASHRLDRLRVNRVGLWLFFFSESLIFGLLLSTRFFLEGIEREHVDQVLGLGITIILLLSSLTAFTAETAIRNGNRALCQWMLLATILLGTIFAVGVGFEWATAHFGRSTPSDLVISEPAEGEEAAAGEHGECERARANPEREVHCVHAPAYGTAFFAMTGTHATHVVSGVIMLVFAWYMVLRGNFSPNSYWGIEGTVKYWHFVDLVWVFFYPALYLVT
jgi:cytochrome c oxidase subunit 3